MQTGLYHLQVNINAANRGFYKDLMAFLGWKTLYEDDATLGVEGNNGASLWFAGGETKNVSNDYDGPGTNHLGIGATAQADVDTTVGYLKDKGVASRVTA